MNKTLFLTGIPLPKRLQPSEWPSPPVDEAGEEQEIRKAWKIILKCSVSITRLSEKSI